MTLVTETITWISVGERMPDVERTVLLHVPEADDPIWVGYLDSDPDAGLSSPYEVWRWADGMRVAQRVTHWADLPAGPGQAGGGK